MTKERRKEREEEEEEEDGDNGFPSFSDLPISASTTHYDVSQRKKFSCACVCCFSFLYNCNIFHCCCLYHNIYAKSSAQKITIMLQFLEASVQVLFACAFFSHYYTHVKLNNLYHNWKLFSIHVI